MGKGGEDDRNASGLPDDDEAGSGGGASLPVSFFPLRADLKAATWGGRRGCSPSTAEAGLRPLARPVSAPAHKPDGGRKAAAAGECSRQHNGPPASAPAPPSLATRHRAQHEMHRDSSDSHLIQSGMSDATLCQAQNEKDEAPEKTAAAEDLPPNQPASEEVTPAPKFMPKVLQRPKVAEQVLKRISTTHLPLWTWVVTGVNVFLLGLGYVMNYMLTGSLIEKPAANPMIGPTSLVLIKMGARFSPCMRPFAQYPTQTRFPCASAAKSSCSLEELCGWGGFPSGQPDQWFRFIFPIFLHGGIVHLLLNLTFQVRVGRHIEEDVGTVRYFLIYMISGVAANVFGANFAPVNQLSVGASGSLFGLIGCLLLDLLHNWRLIEHPRRQLAKMTLMIATSFVVGLLPGIDNFAHLGGFLAGFIASFLLLPHIHFGRWDRRLKLGAMAFAIPMLVTLWALELVNFYKTARPGNSCYWCKYLSCLPVNGWCDAFES